MAWAALARKNVTAAPASKILERRADADGSMYGAVASVLNDSLHVLISVAVLCPRTGRLLLVRDPEAASSRAGAAEGDDALPEFDPNDARAAAAALQLWSRSSLYLVETSLETAGQTVADAARAACRAQAGVADVQLHGIVCVESYLQGLRRNFLRITVAASAAAPSDGVGVNGGSVASSGVRTATDSEMASLLPHVWLDAELCLQPECKLLRSQDFCPYLVAHMHHASAAAASASVSAVRLTDALTLPSHQRDGALGFVSVRVRVAVVHRTRVQLFVVLPFDASSTSSAAGAWVLPETHQDVRGGETLGFAAKRVCMTAFGLEVDLAGVLLVEHDAHAADGRIAPRVTVLAFVDSEPLPFGEATLPSSSASSSSASLLDTLPAEVQAAAASAGVALAQGGHGSGSVALSSKAAWRWLTSAEVPNVLSSTSGVADTKAAAAAGADADASTHARLVSTLGALVDELGRCGDTAAATTAGGLREIDTSGAVAVAPSATVAARFAAPLVDL